VTPSQIAEALLASGSDAIVATDRDGIIRHWNKGAERIFGHTAAEAVGQSLDLIIPEQLRARHWEGYRHVMQTGQSRYGQGDVLAVPGLRKDGSRVSLEFTIATIRDEAGEMIGIAAILRDVTARFEEMKALRKQAAGRG
jgi:PAS domain S-box-containing protein